MKSVSKLATFFDQEIKSGLKDLIITYSNNRYELFGRYRIDIVDGVFKVIDIKHRDKSEFASLKYAVMYCTLANAGKYKESRRLHMLDLKLSSLQVDMAVHKKMIKSASDSEQKCIYTTKLQEDAYQKKLLMVEVNTYINSSKRILESKLHRNFN